MGFNKGLILLNGKSWAQLAYERLTAVPLKTVVSINAEQADQYASFTKDALVVDDPSLDIGGPLLGILSTHIRFPDEDLLVLACDMPNMETVVLEELLNLYRSTDHEVIAFVNNDQIEPLCAIYSAAGLARILQLYRDDKLTRHSLVYLLAPQGPGTETPLRLKTQIIPVKEEWKSYFRNFNSPEDLNFATKTPKH